MEPKAVLDLRELPDHGFGTRSLTWWGTVGMFAIESMTLALGAAAYLYLMMQEPQWPPNTHVPGSRYIDRGDRRVSAERDTQHLARKEGGKI